jgi:hypothetical protein
MTLLSLLDGRRMLIDKIDIRNQKSNNTSSAKRRWPAAVKCLSLLFLLSSCATQNIGKLQSGAEITKIFEDHQILSDHLYYYSGLQGVPDAIIGIQPNYSLRTDRWQQVDLTSLTLKKWIFRMQAVQLMRPQGAWILDPDGNRIGIWFSALRQTPVRLQQNNRVVIVPPDPPKLQRIR